MLRTRWSIRTVTLDFTVTRASGSFSNSQRAYQPRAPFAEHGRRRLLCVCLTPGLDPSTPCQRQGAHGGGHGSVTVETGVKRAWAKASQGDPVVRLREALSQSPPLCRGGRSCRAGAGEQASGFRTLPWLRGCFTGTHAHSHTRTHAGSRLGARSTSATSCLRRRVFPVEMPCRVPGGSLVFPPITEAEIPVLQGPKFKGLAS